MIVNIVYVYVKPEHIEDFKKATVENHEHTINEEGNLRFDVLQDDLDKTKFVLYEAFLSDKAAADHKKTTHYLKWKESVAPWMAKPREGVKHHVLKPDNKDLWQPPSL
jgi:autoinducer 2-degrading protein